MADSELEEIRKSCIEKIHLCADNVIKYLDNDKEEELEKLRSHVKHYCLHEEYPNLIEKVSEKITNELDALDVDRIEDTFKIYLNGNIDKINVRNHPWMNQLDELIKQSGGISENLDESDLAITNTNQTDIDPLTKRPLQNPVRNKLCGHIYEQESILNHIKLKKKGTFCPMVGCGNKERLQQEHLVPHTNIRCHTTTTQQSTMNEVLVYDTEMDSE